MEHLMAERAERISMKQDGSIALFHYWNRLRDGRSAPKRTEIEPADIKSLLADTFILEKDGRSFVPRYHLFWLCRQTCRKRARLCTDNAGYAFRFS